MSRKQLKTSSRIFLLLTLLVIATTLALLFLMLLDNDLNMKEKQQTAVTFGKYSNNIFQFCSSCFGKFKVNY